MGWAKKSSLKKGCFVGNMNKKKGPNHKDFWRKHFQPRGHINKRFKTRTILAYQVMKRKAI